MGGRFAAGEFPREHNLLQLYQGLKRYTWDSRQSLEPSALHALYAFLNVLVPPFSPQVTLSQEVPPLEVRAIKCFGAASGWLDSSPVSDKVPEGPGMVSTGTHVQSGDEASQSQPRDEVKEYLTQPPLTCVGETAGQSARDCQTESDNEKVILASVN